MDPIGSRTLNGIDATTSYGVQRFRSVHMRTGSGKGGFLPSAPMELQVEPTSTKVTPPQLLPGEKLGGPRGLYCTSLRTILCKLTRSSGIAAAAAAGRPFAGPTMGCP